MYTNVPATFVAYQKAYEHIDKPSVAQEVINDTGSFSINVNFLFD